MLARSIPPDREHDEEKVEKYEGCDVSFAADSESVGMQTFAQNKIDAVPRHQHGQQTNRAGDNQSKFSPPTGQTPMQRREITKQRDQRPGLLRVQSPEASPGIIGPHTAENCTCRQQ